MLRVPLAEAKGRLEALVADALRGEEVVIEGDGASVRLVLEPTPATTARVPGRGRGLYEMRDGFDDPLPEFEAYI